MENKKLTRIGIDVDDAMLSRIKEIADKERWSTRMVAMVALENYLKLRESKKENADEIIIYSMLHIVPLSGMCINF